MIESRVELGFESDRFGCCWLGWWVENSDGMIPGSAKDRNPAVKLLGGRIVGWFDGSQQTCGVLGPQNWKSDLTRPSQVQDLTANSALSPILCRSFPVLCMRFNFGPQFATSTTDEGTIQEGVVCAALDAVCANTVVWKTLLQKTVATLEQKVSFFLPIRPGESAYALAFIHHLDDKFAFLETELRVGSIRGPLVATSSQSNLLLKLPPKKKPKL